MIDIISRTVDVLKKKPANGYEEKYARDCSVLLAEIERLKEDLEIERIRLAACGVAASANTEETVKQRLETDHHYYSASYGDVCDAVDREMTYRIENAKLTKERDELKGRYGTAESNHRIIGSYAQRNEYLEEENAKLRRRVEWERCNEDTGEGIVCNAELVDGGEERGIFCPLCELRDENKGLREYSESRDESIAVYREEIKELKERLSCAYAKTRLPKGIEKY